MIDLAIYILYFEIFIAIPFYAISKAFKID